jgi:hypothetical protein
VSSVSIKEWINLLEEADLIYKLKPFCDNCNKRLLKTPKIYFLDTGLAARLQGWRDPAPLISSPQIDALFETLIFAEIIKFIRNYRKYWELFFWRTKEGEQVDFLLKTANNRFYAFEAKLALQTIPVAVRLPNSFNKQFTDIPLILVTFGGRQLELSDRCLVVPIAQLHDYLLTC